MTPEIVIDSNRDRLIVVAGKNLSRAREHASARQAHGNFLALKSLRRNEYTPAILRRWRNQNPKSRKVGVLACTRFGVSICAPKVGVRARERWRARKIYTRPRGRSIHA